MTRRRRVPTATYTGLVVVTTSALVTVALTLGALWAYLVSHDKDAGERLLSAAAAALATTTALAARTRPDPDPQVPQAVKVEQPAGQPVPTTDVPVVPGQLDPDLGT